MNNLKRNIYIKIIPKFKREILLRKSIKHYWKFKNFSEIIIISFNNFQIH